MKRIAVVTVGRSDYSLYLPLLREIGRRTDVSLQLIAAAAHLSSHHGHTMDRILEDGFEIAAKVEFPPRVETPVEAARAMAEGTWRFAEAYADLAPDIVVLLGDRMETHAAGVAAVPSRIPLAHIHGGELSLGAIDDVLRHSLTKFSHLHFAATAESARRIAQMGEEPWRVTFTGALSLDNARYLPRLDGAALREKYSLDAARPFVLVTLHPATLDPGDSGHRARQLIQALSTTTCDVLCTQPNADPGSAAIHAEFAAWAAAEPRRVHYMASLGPNDFIAAMENAAAMVGNSSAGIIEARHYGLPVVNIGTRQEGRTRGANVVDVGWSIPDISKAVGRATSDAFKASFLNEPNPYGDGHAAVRISRLLATAPDTMTLLNKRFVDLPTPGAWKLRSIS